MEEEFSFPPELKININPKNIEIDLEKNPPRDVIDYLLQSQGAERNVILKPKPRTSRTKIISGGTPEKRMEYLLNLLDKLGLYSKPEVLPYPRNILYLLDARIGLGTTREELEAFKDEINLNKFEGYKPPQNISEDAKWENEIIVGPAVSSLIISYLANAEDIPDYLNFIDNLDEVVVSLNLPLRCFVLVSKAEKGYKYSFTDMSKEVTASVVSAQVSSVIKTISSLPIYKAKLIDCDPVKLESLLDIQKETKFHGYAMANVIEDDSSDLVNTDLYILTKSGEDKAKEFANAVFGSVSVHMCAKCHCVFAAADRVCYKFHHAGERIPFGPEDNYQMEVEEFDEDDNPYTMHNYECCGEVPADEPGCVKEENGKHEIDIKHPEISKLEFVGPTIFTKNL